MSDLSGSQLLFYGGIAVMILAAMLAGVCAVFFAIQGKRLGKRLEQEYGKPLS